MDNKLRIKRVKEGIKLLENGIDPWTDLVEKKKLSYTVYFGLKGLGGDLLYNNGHGVDKGVLDDHGFIWDDVHDVKIMLHNWKRFLELIEKL